MIEWDIEKFKRMFPNLYREIFDMPTIYDHFEICKDENEALELIDYFERKGELSKEEAEYLRKNISKFKYLFGKRQRGDFARRGLID